MAGMHACWTIKKNSDVGPYKLKKYNISIVYHVLAENSLEALILKISSRLVEGNMRNM